MEDGRTGAYNAGGPENPITIRAFVEEAAQRRDPVRDGRLLAVGDDRGRAPALVGRSPRVKRQRATVASAASSCARDGSR